ncbi:hypothetical protein [Paralimibaculum aggregatum]|nr:hypothetical protein [Limibaculum sp. NKW23]
MTKGEAESGSKDPGSPARSVLALDFSTDGVALHLRDAGGGWGPAAAAAIEGTGFADRVAALRAVAESEGVAGEPALLWLPPEQVFARRLAADDPALASPAETAAWVGAALLQPPEGLVLAVSEPDGGGTVTVLAALHDTWSEAQDYAAQWGFLPGPVSTRHEADAFGAAGPVFAPVNAALATAPEGPPEAEPSAQEAPAKEAPVPPPAVVPPSEPLTDAPIEAAADPARPAAAPATPGAVSPPGGAVPPRAQPAAAPRPRRTGTIAAVAALLACAGGLAWWLADDPEPRPPAIAPGIAALDPQSAVAGAGGAGAPGDALPDAGRRADPDAISPPRALAGAPDSPPSLERHASFGVDASGGSIASPPHASSRPTPPDSPADTGRTIEPPAAAAPNSDPSPVVVVDGFGRIVRVSPAVLSFDPTTLPAPAFGILRGLGLGTPPRPAEPSELTAPAPLPEAGTLPSRPRLEAPGRPFPPALAPTGRSRRAGLAPEPSEGDEELSPDHPAWPEPPLPRPRPGAGAEIRLAAGAAADAAPDLSAEARSTMSAREIAGGRTLAGPDLAALAAGRPDGPGAALDLAAAAREPGPGAPQRLALAPPPARPEALGAPAPTPTAAETAEPTASAAGESTPPAAGTEAPPVESNGIRIVEGDPARWLGMRLPQPRPGSRIASAPDAAGDGTEAEAPPVSAGPAEAATEASEEPADPAIARVEMPLPRPRPAAIAAPAAAETPPADGGETGETAPATAAGDARRSPVFRTPAPPERPSRLASTAPPALPKINHVLRAPSNSVRIAARDRGLSLDRTSLIGILQLNGGRTALVRTADGAVRRLSRGDRLDGWEVRLIGRDAMRLEQAGQSRTLLLVGR